MAIIMAIIIIIMAIIMVLSSPPAPLNTVLLSDSFSSSLFQSFFFIVLNDYSVLPSSITFIAHILLLLLLFAIAAVIFMLSNYSCHRHLYQILTCKFFSHQPMSLCWTMCLSSSWRKSSREGTNCNLCRYHSFICLSCVLFPLGRFA